MSKVAELPASLAELLTAHLEPRPAPNGNGHKPSGQRPSSRYGDAALAGEVERLLSAHNGTRNDTLNRAAFSLGTLVGAGILDRFMVEDQLMGAALAVGLGETEARKTIASGLDKGCQQPRAVPDHNGSGPEAPPDEWLFSDEPPQPEGAEHEGHEAPRKASRLWTIADLYDTEFPEPAWAIPGILPAGLTLFGGRPKVGKSWLMLQAACAVGTGGRFLGKPIERGAVLYLALEDSPRRLQDRIQKQGIPRHALISFCREWRPLHKGGFDDLLRELERAAYRLVVIDTLTRAFPGIDQKERHRIEPFLDQLQTLALGRNLAIAFNDHTRKPMGQNEDPVDDIMDSTGKTAPADGVLALYKQQGKPGARLMGRGREYEDFDYLLAWDRVTCCWQLEGETGAVRLTERRQEIIDALTKLGRATLTTIAKTIGQPKGNTYTRLQDLVTAGLVIISKVDDDVVYEVVGHVSP